MAIQSGAWPEKLNLPSKQLLLYFYRLECKGTAFTGLLVQSSGLPVIYIVQVEVLVLYTPQPVLELTRGCCGLLACVGRGRPSAGVRT